MNKLLSMIAAITLIETAITNVIACDNKGEKPNPISKYKFIEFSKLNTTIWSPVSYDNIIYVGTNNGVYQNNDDNKDIFLKIEGITGRITSLATDKNNNIYVGSYGKIYKKKKIKEIETKLKLMMLNI